jgi:hypothetical protein
LLYHDQKGSLKKVLRSTLKQHLHLLRPIRHPHHLKLSGGHRDQVCLCWLRQSSRSTARGQRTRKHLFADTNLDGLLSRMYVCTSM